MATKRAQPFSLVRDVEAKKYVFVPVFSVEQQNDLIARVEECRKSRGTDVREQAAMDDKDAIERNLIAEGYVQVAHVNEILGPPPIPAYRRRT